MYKLLLLRYGELGLKGKNRGQFIRRLTDNIHKALPHKKVESTWGRIWLPLDDDLDETLAALKNVFGLHSVSPVVRSGRDLEEIAAAAYTVLLHARPQGGTFKIESRRSDKTFPMKSPELSATVGGMILARCGDAYTVDLHHPDQRIDIEVRTEGVYVFGQRIAMAGGLPVGSSGKAVVMLSGGIDSPVAAYLAMKRGVRVEMVHFHSFPYTSERAKEKVIDLCRILTKFGGAIKLHVVHFTDIQMEIRKTCREDYTITMMRRFMYRLAEKIAENRQALAIYTGEDVGQVASQTLESMACINQAITMPVLRPLCGFDKTEIIGIAEKIGTYETSILPYEDCCTIFLPDFPKIRPRLEDALAMEENMDIAGLMAAALEKTETIVIRSNVD